MEEDIYIVRSQKVRKRVTDCHQFCHNCGSEVTKLDLKKGTLSYKQHRLITFNNGVQVRKCWNGAYCEERKIKRHELFRKI
jgi:hypothetical protein